MTLLRTVLITGSLAASFGPLATLVAAQQNPPTSPVVPPAAPSTRITIYGAVRSGSRKGASDLSLGAADAKSREIHGLLTKRTDVTMTANGATVTFTRPVYVRVWPEQAGAKVDYSSFVDKTSIGNGKERYGLHCTTGNMAFTVFNDSEGKNLLLTVRAASIIYSFTRPETPDIPNIPAVTPPK